MDLATEFNFIKYFKLSFIYPSPKYLLIRISCMLAYSLLKDGCDNAGNQSNRIKRDKEIKELN
jgi:hypothetical protein